MRADRVTIHHEGGGAPTDRVSRFLNAARYSAGIGITRYELVRAPEQSFTTVGQHGKCLQICLSGHRGKYPVTDSDLVLIGRCCDEARAKGWLTLTPVLYLHGDTMATECPGAFTEARRLDLEVAIRATVPVVTPAPPAPGPPTEGDDMPSGAQIIVRTHSGAGYYIAAADGGVFAYGDAQFYGSMGGEKMAAPVVGMELTSSGAGYWLLGQDGGVFAFGDAQFYGSAAGDIAT